MNEFAEDLSFAKIFIFFVIGSLFGSFYEEVIFFVQSGSWTVRHDLLFGPFSSLYGFGVIIFLILLVPHSKKRSILKTFLYAMFIGGIAEYTASWFFDVFLNIRFWDYSGMFSNINGRTTILFMIVWGIMGTILVKIIYPFISKLIERIPINVGQPIFIIILILMILNVLLSYSVFMRMVYRNKGYEPLTFV